MASCPQCSAAVPAGAAIPTNSEFLLRGAGYARWRGLLCGKCGAVLESEPWTRYLALAICILLLIVPAILIGRRMKRLHSPATEALALVGFLFLLRLLFPLVARLRLSRHSRFNCQIKLAGSAVAEHE